MARTAECDERIEAVLLQLNADRELPTEAIPEVRHARGRNEPRFDVRAALHTFLRADLSQVHGFGPYTVLRIAAVNIGRTQTVLGAFYRRLASRTGKAKAVTATVRKLAVLFSNAMRFGMKYVDPGKDYYEERYRQRVLSILSRRAKQFGYALVEAAELQRGVSSECEGPFSWGLCY